MAEDPFPPPPPSTDHPSTMVLNGLATLIVIALVLGWWLSH